MDLHSLACLTLLMSSHVFQRPKTSASGCRDFECSFHDPARWPGGGVEDDEVTLQVERGELGINHFPQPRYAFF
jgi:hypothetical protein